MNKNINDANETRICSDCGCVIEDDNFVTTWDGRIICEDCYENDYFLCEDCDRVFPNSEAVPVSGGYYVVCEGCADSNYYRCDVCGGYFTRDEVHTDDYGTVVCDHCYNWYDFTTCYDCGRISTENYWSDEIDEYLCATCESRRDANGTFHGYNYKPDPQFFMCDSDKQVGKDDLSAPYFGIELEIDYGDDHCEVTKAISDLDLPVYCKHDGSLDDEGVECVTHPCTLTYHENEFDWQALMDTAKRHHYKSHDTTTCGLHIHVNRRCMGDTVTERKRTAGNLVLLCKPLWDKLVVFSRREERKLNDWAAQPTPYLEQRKGEYSWRWSKDTELTGKSDLELTRMALNTENSGRYQAVNLTNSSTVEFRLFRGTLKRDTLLASIALVNNMVVYAKSHTPTECLNATFEDVVSAENHEVLNEYCRSKNLI